MDDKIKKKNIDLENKKNPREYTKYLSCTVGERNLAREGP